MEPDRKLLDEIRANLAGIRARLEKAARTSGRSADDVRLIGISKSFGAEYIEAAVGAGVTEIGENRVREAALKISRLASKPVLHMVGHLQANKVREALRVFDWIHSVDSCALMARIGRIAQETGRNVSVLIQVKLAEETTKHGAQAVALQQIADAARPYPNVSVEGLMCIPPFFEDAQDARPFYARMRGLLHELRAGQAEPDVRGHLSMGMSHDFEVAVEEGATMIRVGTALFGARRVQCS